MARNSCSSPAGIDVYIQAQALFLGRHYKSVLSGRFVDICV
ncbi:hypothetical protein BVRB_5g109610 [Beta vulgaris subsp. vulgaris]|nr:hypothetical protein BVRB_5g109610 [Beta vulgaris subsp. vulgaris]